MKLLIISLLTTVVLFFPSGSIAQNKVPPDSSVSLSAGGFRSSVSKTLTLEKQKGIPVALRIVARQDATTGCGHPSINVAIIDQVLGGAFFKVNESGYASSEWSELRWEIDENGKTVIRLSTAQELEIRIDIRNGCLDFGLHEDGA